MFTTGNGYNTARGFMTTPTKEQIEKIKNCYYRVGKDKKKP